ncbi:MAG: helix-turn-helix domain-containing protein [Nitrososphaeraceae archaeon]
MRRKLDEWKVTDICKTIKISRTSFYRYRNKYQKDGFEVLKDKFRRPHTIHSTDRKMEQKIV